MILKKVKLLLVRSFFFVSLLILTLSLTMNKPKRVIFFGDSITELGVADGGYIKQLSELLEKKGLSGQFELIGAGVSGNQINDLYRRLQKDVISREPDLVIIYIGINDVWQKEVGTGTDEGEFKTLYESLITKIQASGAEVVLCTPTVIGERKGGINQLDGELDHYADIIRQLAKDHKTRLVDLRSIFVQYNHEHNPGNKEMGILTNDRVHLNKKGNQLVSNAMFDLLLSDVQPSSTGRSEIGKPK